MHAWAHVSTQARRDADVDADAHMHHAKCTHERQATACAPALFEDMKGKKDEDIKGKKDVHAVCRCMERQIG